MIRQAQRLIDRLDDAVRLERRVLDMRDGEAADRLTAFRERLRVVMARRRDAVDLAEAEGRRLLAVLNDESGRAARSLTAEVRERIGTAIEERHRPGEIEREGRDRLVALARSSVEGWREARRRSLEKGLADLDARLTGMLDRELAGVRDDAAEYLGLDLAVPADEGRLIENPRFFYVLSESAGQTELLAGAIRRWVPGEFGRRRAREHVLGEAAELVPKQIGRARADLQYRLADATRELVRALDHRYAESVDRLGPVVDAASNVNTDERARTRRLGETEAALNTLRARLKSATDSDGSCTS